MNALPYFDHEDNEEEDFDPDDYGGYDDSDNNDDGYSDDDIQLFEGLGVDSIQEFVEPPKGIVDNSGKEELLDYFQKGSIVQTSDHTKRSKLDSYYTKVYLEDELVPIIYINTSSTGYYDLYNTVDLSLIPEEYKYNKEKKFWQKNGKKSKAPSLESVNGLLEADRHPYCHIRQLSSVYSYLHSIVINEDSFEDRYRKLDIQPTVTEEISLKRETYNQGYTPRFSVIEKTSNGGLIREDRDKLATVVKSIADKVTCSSQFWDLEGTIEKWLYPENTSSYSSYNSNKSNIKVKETLKVPLLPKEEVEALVAKAKSSWSNDDSWINDPPSITEFQDNSYMVNRIMEHCGSIKGFKLNYCRLREQVAYFSDGNFNTTPDCIHVDKEGNKDHTYRIYQHKKTRHMLLGKPDLDKIREGDYSWDESSPKYCLDKDLAAGMNYYRLTYPCLYLGPTWTIYFTFIDDDGEVVDGLQGNEIHVVTGKMWKEAIYPYRPDLVEDWNPPDDELYYVASHWCSRNGSHNYHNGIDLYSLYQQRLTLFQWILTFFASRCLSYNVRLPFVDANNVVNGHSKMTRLNKISSYLNKFNSFKPEEAPVVLPNEEETEWSTVDSESAVSVQ